MIVRKRPWIFVCLCCVRLYCVENVFQFVRANPSVDELASDLVSVLSVCVCLCVCGWVCGSLGGCL